MNNFKLGSDFDNLVSPLSDVELLKLLDFFDDVNRLPQALFVLQKD